MTGEQQCQTTDIQLPPSWQYSLARPVSVTPLNTIILTVIRLRRPTPCRRPINPMLVTCRILQRRQEPPHQCHRALKNPRVIITARTSHPPTTTPILVPRCQNLILAPCQTDRMPRYTPQLPFVPQHYRRSEPAASGRNTPLLLHTSYFATGHEMAWNLHKRCTAVSQQDRWQG
jgi:hypothetical protein